MMKLFFLFVNVTLFFIVNANVDDISHDLSWLFSIEDVNEGDNIDDDNNDINNINDNVAGALDDVTINTCDTDECRQIADEFNGGMNTTVDPCENFYEYVCGGWPEKNPIPKYLPGWNRIMMFQLEVKYRIKEILETSPAPQDILPVRQAKKWFRSCMDQEAHDSRGINPIESILMQIGGWPMTMDEEEWDEDNYTWQKVEEFYVKLTGAYTLYDIKLKPAYIARFGGSISIRSPSMPLNDLLPTDNRNYTGEQYEAYRAFLENTTRLFITHNRADVSDDQLERDINDLIDFEEQLYKYKSMISNRWSSKNVNISGLTEWYNNLTSSDNKTKSQIDWNNRLQNILDFGNVKVDESMQMTIKELTYFQNLPTLLENTSSRTIVNYIHWNFVTLSLRFTMDKFRDLFFQYLNKEYGVEERPPRWLECVEEVDMKHAAAYAFVEKYFPTSTKEMAEKMAENIRNQVKEQIVMSDWLNDTAKEILKGKLKDMEYFIGFPDWYENHTAVVNYYKGLTIGYGYFDNGLSFLRYKKKLEVEAYEKTKENTPWRVDPITVNAVYYLQRNLLNIPAANFQSPLFAPGMPDSVNYGITGVIMGHEISHAFDVKGMSFGSNGARTKLDRATMKNYYDNVQCFKTQFDKYIFYHENGTRRKITKENINEFGVWGMTRGQLTAGENIADTTSLDAVFEAYKYLLKNDKPNGENKLPGFEDYTDEQLFFISFAGTWCEAGTNKFFMKRKNAIDVHSPPNLRVIGAVSNSKEFSRVFKCPIGSRMNPINKCNIWMKSSIPELH